MNGVIEFHGGRRVNIPVGLPELVHDIGKEVLYHQPENLILFIAEYLEKRVEERSKQDALKKALETSAKAILSLPKETEIILKECGVDLFTAEVAARTIQATFRGYLVRERLKKERSVQYRHEVPDGSFDDNEENYKRQTISEDSSSIRARDEEYSVSIEYSALSSPEVDFIGTDPFDELSTFDDVSTSERIPADVKYSSISSAAISLTPSFAGSTLSTNTITGELAGELKTYLDFSEIKTVSSDPFKQYSHQTNELMTVTSDLEIFKHIDMEQYEDKKTIDIMREDPDKLQNMKESEERYSSYIKGSLKRRSTLQSSFDSGKIIEDSNPVEDLESAGEENRKTQDIGKRGSSNNKGSLNNGNTFRSSNDGDKVTKDSSLTEGLNNSGEHNRKSKGSKERLSLNNKGSISRQHTSRSSNDKDKTSKDSSRTEVLNNEGDIQDGN